MNTQTTSDYIRFAALGDSASCGVGDPTPAGWRGWAQILADAIADKHQVSFWKLAVPGATVADVRREQLPEALAHQPHLASLVVGLNDTMRSTWDPAQVRADLLHIAGKLARHGAVLITVRFHDHTQVIGLPEFVARPMRRRIAVLNQIYDEVHERYGVIQLDLSADPSIYNRRFWAFDRLHPSELGHRWLAARISERLHAEGLSFALPPVLCSRCPSRAEDARTLVQDVLPWLGRRARDLGPAALKSAARRTQTILCRDPNPVIWPTQRVGGGEV